MSEVTDLIAAIVAIAKDPKGWEKRLGNVKEAGSKLAEARMAEKQATDKAKAAATDLETARYERGQAEHASRTAAAQATANAAGERELKGHEAELAAREQAAEQKLETAQRLMASYDEAKHQAAMKLAS